MRALLTLVHLLLSAAIASGAGGVLLTGLMGVSGLAAMLAGDPAGAVRALPDALVFLLVLAGVAVAGTIYLAIVPAALVGGLLRAAGATRPWARTPLAWAAGGAAVAFALFLWAQGRMTGRGPLEAMAGIDWVLPALCALAGAGAGLAYRAALAATAPFFGWGGDEQSVGREMERQG
jgi:hypothetical protein